MSLSEIVALTEGLFDWATWDLTERVQGLRVTKEQLDYFSEEFADDFAALNRERHGDNLAQPQDYIDFAEGHQGFPLWWQECHDSDQEDEPVEGEECDSCGYLYAFNGRGELVCDCDCSDDDEGNHPDHVGSAEMADMQ